MKNHHFRFRLIAVLLVALLTIAGIYGVRTIPLTGSGSSLRDAILRLTGQVMPSPIEAEERETPSVPSSATESAPEAVAPTPSLSDTLGQILFPSATDLPSPDPEAVAREEAGPSPAPPLSEALSSYFGSPVPDSTQTPSTAP